MTRHKKPDSPPAHKKRSVGGVSSERARFHQVREVLFIFTFLEDRKKGSLLSNLCTCQIMGESFVCSAQSLGTLSSDQRLALPIDDGRENEIMMGFFARTRNE